MNEQRPEVYLDLDGVLADFFTEYAKLAGITSGNYRDVPAAKTDPTLQKMIGTDFFARLPVFSSADQLIKMTVKLFGRYHICSSPLRGDHENTEYQKKIWIKKHLSPPPATIIITPNKAKYAVQKDGTPNILVDDRGSNIAAWEAKGGIGIKYQADEDSLQVIVDGFARARKLLKGDVEEPSQKLKQNDHSEKTAENGEINPRFQQNPIMARESASSGATSAGSIASSPVAGGGWLFGGTVGAPKKKKKTKVVKR